MIVVIIWGMMLGMLQERISGRDDPGDHVGDDAVDALGARFREGSCGGCCW